MFTVFLSCDVDRQRRRSGHCSGQYNAGDPKNDYTNDFFCYNCIREKSADCRVQAKKFCLDCDVPLCEEHLKVC